uniref:Histone H1 n=1 Tax=Steinernema glaseri TaxID=37863 RepID=A0A1I7Y3F9_9BILA
MDIYRRRHLERWSVPKLFAQRIVGARQLLALRDRPVRISAMPPLLLRNSSEEAVPQDEQMAELHKRLVNSLQETHTLLTVFLAALIIVAIYFTATTMYDFFRAHATQKLADRLVSIKVDKKSSGKRSKKTKKSRGKRRSAASKSKKKKKRSHAEKKTSKSKKGGKKRSSKKAESKRRSEKSAKSKSAKVPKKHGSEKKALTSEKLPPTTCSSLCA